MTTQRILSKKLRQGFTLVELLVVIAIIGILVALLLPAVQAARESGRNAQCKNNLRQIGLAMLNYEAAHRALPAGGWSSGWTGDPNMGTGTQQPGGWIYQSAPYVEQVSIASLGIGSTGDALKATLTEQGKAVIPIFNCPSRRPAELYQAVELLPMNYNSLDYAAKSDYAANGGNDPGVRTKGQGPQAQAPFVTSDCFRGYPNCKWMNSQAWLDLRWNGIIADRLGARIVQITDGTSKTLLAGEKWLYVLYYDIGSVDDPFDNQTNQIAKDNPGDNGPMYIGYDYDNMRGCSGELDNNNKRVGYLPRRDTEYDLKNQQLDKKGAHFKESFGGPHPGGVNLVKCDGSVYTESFDVDPYVWASLGGRNDGEL